MEFSSYMRRAARNVEQAAAASILAGCEISPERARQLRAAIEVAAESFDDGTALKYPELYPAWEPGAIYPAEVRVRHGKTLWRCLQEHTSQAGWEPSTDTASLWEQIDEGHAGTLDDPIPYDGNMALEEGMHYVQDGVIYRCVRDTGSPVYNDLADLIGVYVETV